MGNRLPILHSHMQTFERPCDWGRVAGLKDLAFDISRDHSRGAVNYETKKASYP